MSLSYRIGRAAVKLASKGMSSKQKAALKKAQKASAAARKKSIAKVDKMKLKRVKEGFTDGHGQKRISASNFKSRADRLKSYDARLASSRAKYKTNPVKNTLKQKVIGAVNPISPTGLGRRRYSDLTTGENVRRNIRRTAIVGGVAAGAAYGTGKLVARKRKKKK